MPVHLVVGEHDEKFTAIAEDMKPLISTSEMTVVANAGHTVHLENPTATGQLLDSVILRND